jgi:hypothetical protein
LHFAWRIFAKKLRCISVSISSLEQTAGAHSVPRPMPGRCVVQNLTTLLRKLFRPGIQLISAHGGIICRRMSWAQSAPAISKYQNRPPFHSLDRKFQHRSTFDLSSDPTLHAGSFLHISSYSSTYSSTIVIRSNARSVVAKRCKWLGIRKGIFSFPLHSFLMIHMLIYILYISLLSWTFLAM